MDQKKKTKIDIDRMAELANLTLGLKEKSFLIKQIEKAINYVGILKDLKAKARPTFQVTDLENISREDKAKAPLAQEKALENAPRRKNGYFSTKRIKWE